MELTPGSNDVRHEVCRLASDLVDQRIDEEKMQRLAYLMESHSEARASFIDFMTLSAQLEVLHEPALGEVLLGQALDACDGNLSCATLEEERDCTHTAVQHIETKSKLIRRTGGRSIGRFVLWSLAGSLLIAAAVRLWSGGRENPSSPSQFIAVLAKQSGVQWSGNWVPKTVPARLVAGQRLCLAVGTAEVTFNNGCTITIKGPADVTLDSPLRVLARQGTVRARVGEDAQGFVIETPATQVVDLGTEFGVSVDAATHDTDVVVFEGAVNLMVGSTSSKRRPESLDTVTRKLTRLVSGEALRVDRAGITQRITSIRSDDFPMSIAPLPIGIRPPLIRNVSDNIRDPKAASYYQIVLNGLREDSRAYVDRFHEWNGLDEKGIPPFLLGADYVMCFNSDKWKKNFEMTVDVAAPAELFVFFDDRVPVPQWLRQRFIQTEFKIGIDEGYHDGKTPYVTDIGPSRSIDQVYSVWKRVVPEPTQVHLGSLPANILEVSMYGIAAVPLGMGPPEMPNANSGGHKVEAIGREPSI